jgi:lipopolysaccharide/colanic/teichoic acid biosynthesis glycosyltransferase
VGPRPITEQELQLYSDEDRKKLLSVKPGLTGYWQVFGKNRATYQNGERIRMELFYADHACAALDLIILLLTPASAVNSIIKKGREMDS